MFEHWRQKLNSNVEDEILNSRSNNRFDDIVRRIRRIPNRVLEKSSEMEKLSRLFHIDDSNSSITFSWYNEYDAACVFLYCESEAV